MIVGGVLGQHVVGFVSGVRWQTGAGMVQTGDLHTVSFRVEVHLYMSEQNLRVIRLEMW